ncbi:hypothetical protein GK108_10475 [Spirosoma terrae]|uniref:Abortive phage infection protein C-terminal domain-containing protein n=1 Tax=Spirosoma terrae TaxID=1968276 RepID=A0A6L9L710_9BACT|nr:hypothetical protein [Spirosoma terrae]
MACTIKISERFWGKRQTLTRQYVGRLPKNPLTSFTSTTALANTISTKGLRPDDKNRRLDVDGFSIVNGAQTITSAAQFMADNLGADLTAARVSITLIDTEGGSQNRISFLCSVSQRPELSAPIR